MRDVAAPQAWLERQRRIWAYEHGHASGAASRSRVALFVERDVASHNNGVTAVPRGRLDPVESVEERVGTTIASVHSVNALNVRITAGLEELHKHRLDGFGLVEEGFGADFEAADRGGID